MKCTECGSRIEKSFTEVFCIDWFSFNCFCGFLIFAPIQLFFVGVIVILIALTQIEKDILKMLRHWFAKSVVTNKYLYQDIDLF